MTNTNEATWKTFLQEQAKAIQPLEAKVKELQEQIAYAEEVNPKAPEVAQWRTQLRGFQAQIEGMKAALVKRGVKLG